MSIKLLFIITFLIIIASLGTALFHLAKPKDPEHSRKTLKALTIRISLSLLLFIIMYIVFITGQIKPEGIGARIQAAKQIQRNTTSTIEPQ